MNPKSDKSDTPAKPQLDHDNDGKAGGIAPIPDVQHLVVTQDHAERGLIHGEVIGVNDAEAKALLKSDHVRVATDTEIELAQPRVRILTA